MSHSKTFEFSDSPELSEDDYVANIPAGIASTELLFEALYQGLELPGYFGFNWNALSDCLRDFHWLKQRRVILRHADLPRIPGTDLRIYLDVLEEAVTSWKAGEEHLFKVVFPAALEPLVLELFK